MHRGSSVVTPQFYQIKSFKWLSLKSFCSQQGKPTAPHLPLLDFNQRRHSQLPLSLCFCVHVHVGVFLSICMHDTDYYLASAYQPWLVPIFHYHHRTHTHTQTQQVNNFLLQFHCWQERWPAWPRGKRESFITHLLVQTK